ncbi:hypothetical protein H920_05179 [Fukomys damarensis]|uniref:Uncharacterized protein n=1 Tax=Fukomys damarensis TaxID=885580 RepID=A0A091DT01_FUKDA|nr:hypothetical protein H920_05179 [Fukomys damarensis]
MPEAVPSAWVGGSVTSSLLLLEGDTATAQHSFRVAQMPKTLPTLVLPWSRRITGT